MRTQINPFLRAHGASPGPLMRPKLTGFLASILSGAILLALLSAFGVLTFLIEQYGWPEILFALCAYCTIAGILYGQVYRRAANDLRGGWLFGASTGFILWMFNPLIWLPWLDREPLFVGTEALIFMLTHVLHGALMGLLYPWLHFICKRRSAKQSLTLASGSFHHDLVQLTTFHIQDQK